MTSSVLADSEISLTNPLVLAHEPAASAGERSRPTGDDPQWDRILDELERLRALPRDWDGQGAAALKAANMDAAAAWVREMRRWQRALPPSFVAPGTSGEIVLEWRGESFHLAAEIGEPSRIEWLLNIPGQPLKQWETDAQGPWLVRAER